MTTATRAPFEPKGAEAEWRPVYRAVKKLKTDGIITYAELEELLGHQVSTDRSAIYRAIRELEKIDKRTMEVVPRVGYRVVEAREHERLARVHQKRSRRQLGRSLRKVRSADRRHLTAEEAARLDDLEGRFSRLESMVRRLDDRQKVTENRQDKVERESADLAAQFQKLQDSLARRGLLDEPLEQAA
jgi:chaperonin cofactor prefoldin